MIVVPEMSVLFVSMKGVCRWCFGSFSGMVLARQPHAVYATHTILTVVCLYVSATYHTWCRHHSPDVTEACRRLSLSCVLYSNSSCFPRGLALCLLKLYGVSYFWLLNGYSAACSSQPFLLRCSPFSTALPRNDAGLTIGCLLCLFPYTCCCCKPIAVPRWNLRFYPRPTAFSACVFSPQRYEPSKQLVLFVAPKNYCPSLVKINVVKSVK